MAPAAFTTPFARIHGTLGTRTIFAQVPRLPWITRDNVLIGYADGRDATCAAGGANNRGALATVAKQAGGSSLFAAYDG